MLTTTFIANLLVGVLAGIGAQTGLANTLSESIFTDKSHTIHLGVYVVENDLSPSIQGYRLSYDITSNCNANITLVPVGQSGHHHVDAGAVFYTANTTAGVVGFPDSGTGKAPVAITSFAAPFPGCQQMGFVSANCEGSNVPTTGFSTVSPPAQSLTHDALSCRDYAQYKASFTLARAAHQTVKTLGEYLILTIVLLQVNESTGAPTHLHIPGGTWIACKAEALSFFFGDADLAGSDDILLAYKNATDRLPLPCAEIQLWPICDDVVEAPQGWNELPCFEVQSSTENASIPSTTSIADFEPQLPSPFDSGVSGAAATSIIAVFALIATASALL